MQQSAVISRFRWLASLRLTLVLIGLLAASVVLVYVIELGASTLLALPIGLLALNLLAAIAAQPAFRRQTALLMFHLALLAILMLLAAGRLSYLDGRLELTEGVPFDGTLIDYDAGPLHPWHLRQTRFVNGGFSIVYAAGLKRGPTENRVRWLDEDGVERSTVIGDHRPLVLRGYRFYTSTNKGFAPEFTWLPNEGAPVRGAVHLPSYPVHEYTQAHEWQPPGSRERVWVMLKLDEPVLDPEQPSIFHLPERHRLIVRAGEARHVLTPGQRLALSDGVLVYDGLRSWMGYRVSYDLTRPWLLAACLVAAGSLAWHFARRFASVPW